MMMLSGVWLPRGASSATQSGLLERHLNIDRYARYSLYVGSDCVGAFPALPGDGAHYARQPA
jgi:hypothetical protein